MAQYGYVIVSSTGNIAEGTRLRVRQNTWRMSKPPSDYFVGLDGDASVSTGAAGAKVTIEFTGLCQKVGTAPYCSLSGTGQTVETWQTAKVVKVTDVYGTTRDMLWVSGYNPIPRTGGVNGDAEYYAVDVKLITA